MANKLPFDNNAFIPGSLQDLGDARLLPASARTADHQLASPTGEIRNFLKKDLMVDKLNRIGPYLWLAGQPMPPKPLNYQVATCREIAVDERIDMHMVWEDSQRIHLKPLPRYLLDPQFWESHLVCKGLCCVSAPDKVNQEQQLGCRKELHKCALGFLSSYMALVRFESDFFIAQTYRLLPNTITWEMWLKLNQQLLRNDANNPANINSRYLFGELRLSRLNKICMIFHARPLSAYQITYHTYGELFHDYLTPVTAATIYVALVLTAMQVGLATNRLALSSPFQDASYGFTVFAILGPLIGILFIGVIWGLAFTNNMIGSWKFKQQQFALYEQSLVRDQLP
ncbi:uncharacterized protein N7515_007326 [Penicillium bovifimosum]|uniref:Uncharacterized protein n=1 Tax=Penicillium bovifimosum TaxID=126998 RepID=A0A9W9GWE9_9EURO|nr:uncharacterized protein N7515_007326 [Penicillium bovifimosum]KAJ5131287.1 hypothetical protein N7515_007326 [Penicillium bovifimosum]